MDAMELAKLNNYIDSAKLHLDELKRWIGKDDPDMVNVWLIQVQQDADFLTDALKTQ